METADFRQLIFDRPFSAKEVILDLWLELEMIANHDDLLASLRQGSQKLWLQNLSCLLHNHYREVNLCEQVTFDRSATWAQLNIRTN